MADAEGSCSDHSSGNIEMCTHLLTENIGGWYPAYTVGTKRKSSSKRKHKDKRSFGLKISWVVAHIMMEWMSS